MKTNRIKICLVCAHPFYLLFSLVLARGRTKIEMRNRIYSQWSQQFLVTKGNQSYVRTTSDSEEQQFYLKPKVMACS